jgi:triacylglycerol lipase
MRRTLACLVLMIATSVIAAPRETVVVLHGVALNRLICLRLEWALERAGYDVINVSIPSRRVLVSELGDVWLPTLLRTRGTAQSPRLHFVTHSMGGLIVRRTLEHERPANLGRVVMIGPPNRGSELADHLSQSRFWRWLIGVNLRRLGTGPEAFWRELKPSVEYPVGIIAGTRFLNPLGAFHLPKPHDGAVSLLSTHLDGETEHLEQPYSHTGLLFRAATARHTISFLRSGHFVGTAQ